MTGLTRDGPLVSKPVIYDTWMDATIASLGAYCTDVGATQGRTDRRECTGGPTWTFLAGAGPAVTDASKCILPSLGRRVRRLSTAVSRVDLAVP
jgi:hypothetical protein